MSKIETRPGWAHKNYLNEEFAFDYASKAYLINYPFMMPYYNQYSATWSVIYKTFYELRDAGTLYLRDGALSLLKFIKDNEDKIYRSKTKYLIDKKIEFIVPPRLYSKFQSYTVVQTRPDTNSELVFATHVDTITDTTDLLASLDKINSKNKYKKIYIYLRSNENHSMEELLDEPNKDYKILQLLLTRYKNCEIVSLRWMLNNVSQGKFDYFEWNPFSLFYSDSFFHHLFAANGNCVIGMPDKNRKNWTAKLSPFHGMIISPINCAKLNNKFNLHLQTYFNDEQFELEDELNDNVVRFEEIKLYSNEYIQVIHKFIEDHQ